MCGTSAGLVTLTLWPAGNSRPRAVRRETCANPFRRLSVSLTDIGGSLTRAAGTNGCFTRLGGLQPRGPGEQRKPYQDHTHKRGLLARSHVRFVVTNSPASPIGPDVARVDDPVVHTGDLDTLSRLRIEVDSRDGSPGRRGTDVPVYPRDAIAPKAWTGSIPLTLGIPTAERH